MIKKRLWIALMAIPICLALIFIIGAQRSHPASAGGVIDPTCTSSLPCIEYDNNSNGPGIRGVSLAGNGLIGFTKFNSTSAANGRFGIGGNDLSTSGSFNSGVKGISVRGTGVTGTSTSGSAISGTSSSGVGVRGSSSTSAGVFGVSSGTEAVGGVSSGSGPALFGFSSKGVGLEAESINNVGASVFSSFVGANITGGFDNVSVTPNRSYPALSVVGNGGSSTLIAACDSGTSPCYDEFGPPPAVFMVFSNGNVDITGTMFTGGSCSVGCAPTSLSGEKRVRFFTPRESLPTVEDFGDARLVSGLAYVHIDPAFANTIDPRANYMVFITPEGDSRGLYVTAKTPAGFAVHENQSGRSTLAFSYRIVAKPFGENPVRLQAFTLAKPVAPRASKATHTY